MTRANLSSVSQSGAESCQKELGARRAELRALEDRARASNEQLAIEDVRDFVREELEKRESTESEAATKDAVKARRFVRNDRTAAIHAVAVAGALVPPVSWATRCGWKFGLKMHTLLGVIPEDVP